MNEKLIYRMYSGVQKGSKPVIQKWKFCKKHIRKSLFLTSVQNTRQGERGKNLLKIYYQYLKISLCLWFLHTVVAALWNTSPSFLAVWFLLAALALNSLYLDLFSVTLDSVFFIFVLIYMCFILFPNLMTITTAYCYLSQLPDEL